MEHCILGASSNLWTEDLMVPWRMCRMSITVSKYRNKTRAKHGGHSLVYSFDSGPMCNSPLRRI